MNQYRSPDSSSPYIPYGIDNMKLVQLTDSEIQSDPQSHGEIETIETCPENPLVSLENVYQRGPGMAEAILWILGVIVVQLLAMQVAILLLFVSIGLQEGSQAVAKYAASPVLLFKEHMASLFCCSQLLYLGIVLFAGSRRLQPDPVKSLSFRPILLKHFVLMIMILCPLMIVNKSLHMLVVEGWQQLLIHVPQLSFLDTQDSMQIVGRLAENTSPLMLLLTIAFVPAIAEELVFRGVIGRGLLARYGLIGGIAITSVLFALVHINPPHVLALLPLAAIMHISYIATKSFWAPILLHFFNNAAAVVALALAQEGAHQADVKIPILVTVSAAFCVAGCLAALWKSRIQYVSEENIEWSPGYVTVEAPPAESGISPTSQAIPYRYRWFILAAFMSLTYAMSKLADI